MALHQVDHFLIQTADLGQTRDWYVRVLGMTEGRHTFAVRATDRAGNTDPTPAVRTLAKRRK